jgi:hypothetical protein
VNASRDGSGRRSILTIRGPDRQETPMSPKVPSWLDLKPVRVAALDARGPGLRGPTAMGALALGAAAFGAVAIGRLAIGRAVVKRLVIEELEVGRLRVRDLEIENERQSQTR